MILSLSANGLIVINTSEWISPSAEGDQGLCPMEPATFEKVDETFIPELHTRNLKFSPLIYTL